MRQTKPNYPSKQQDEDFLGGKEEGYETVSEATTVVVQPTETRKTVRQPVTVSHQVDAKRCYEIYLVVSPTKIGNSLDGYSIVTPIITVKEVLRRRVVPTTTEPPYF